VFRVKPLDGGAGKKGHNKGAGFGVTELTGGLSRQGTVRTGSAPRSPSTRRSRREVDARWRSRCRVLGFAAGSHGGEQGGDEVAATWLAVRLGGRGGAFVAADLAKERAASARRLEKPTGTEGKVRAFGCVLTGGFSVARGRGHSGAAWCVGDIGPVVTVAGRADPIGEDEISGGHGTNEAPRRTARPRW
jgi:hypothetical protein